MKKTDNVYETDHSLSEYLLFHYGDPKEILPYEFGPFQALGFPKKCAELVVSHALITEHSAALDLGCAVGRSSFELARICKRVVGVDYSLRFIEVANNLKKTGKVNFLKRIEGELTESVYAKVPEGIDRNRVEFIQGDACSLPSNIGTFHLVLLANLIDRLPSPRACLNKIADLTIPGGVLVITSPYTWMEEFTPKEEWLGGITENGISVRSLETLEKCLQEKFEHILCQDIPFLIREHARKFQWSVAQATVWKRR